MRILVLLSMLVTSAACRELAGVDPSTEISRDLSFSFWESRSSEYDPPVRRLVVYAVDEEYPCSNFQLQGTVVRAERVLEVTTDGSVQESEVCLTALGPARFVAEVELETGRYELVFRNAGRTDLYVLEVSDVAFTLEAIKQTFTDPESTSFPMSPTVPLPDSLRTPDPECSDPAPLGHTYHAYRDAEYQIYLESGVSSAAFAEYVDGLPGTLIHFHWTPSSGGYGSVWADMPPEHVPTIRCRSEVLRVWRSLDR